VQNLKTNCKSQVADEMKNMVEILQKPIEGSQFGCTTIPVALDEEREAGPDWLWASNTNRVVGGRR